MSDLLKILIVEDDLRLATTLRHLVELNPRHKVTAVAYDLDSALQAVEVQQPNLALVDLQLANATSGFSVAAKLRDRGILCLFMTGNAPSFPLPDLALGCLTKPFREPELAFALSEAEDLLRGHRKVARSRELPDQLQIYSSDVSAAARSARQTETSDCPNCASSQAKSPDLGRLRVVEAPPKAFVDGEELRVGITQVRLLGALARTGVASRDQLAQIGVGPNAGPKTLNTQLTRLRHALKPHGFDVRAIPKWGYELAKHGRRVGAGEVFRERCTTSEGSPVA